MATFTGWVQAADGQGTIWIDTVEANDTAGAIDAALGACADDWGRSPDDLHVLGIAAGDVEIQFWEDIT